MKKYITIAALLAAGSAFVNAAPKLKTTFGNANQSDASKVKLKTEWLNATLDTVSVSWGKLVANQDTEWLGLQTKNGAGGDEAFLSPNTNVGSGNTWTLSLNYDFGNQSLYVDTISFHVATFNNTGVWQGSDTNRYFDFSVKLGEASGSISNVLCNGNNGTGYDIDITLDSAITVTGKQEFLLTASKNANNELGCFIGVRSITIPEPSTFGLLAGLGALALVGARRRRK